jgi:hypothetical protein
VEAAINNPTAVRVAGNLVKHGVATGVGAIAGHLVGGPMGSAAGAVVGNSLLPQIPATGASNYTKAMGGSAERLSPADVAYRTKMGQPMLADQYGTMRAVPSAAEAEAVASKSGVLSMLAKIAEGLKLTGVVQSGLDLAQIAEPTRTDIGFMGIGGTADQPAVRGADGQMYEPQPALINRLLQYVLSGGR